MDKDAAATVANKIAKEGLTGANKKLITSNAGLKLSLGKLGLALAAIAAVIGTLVFIYNKCMLYRLSKIFFFKIANKIRFFCVKCSTIINAEKAF